MTLEIIFLIIGGYVQKKEDNIASVFLFLQFFFSLFSLQFFLAFINPQYLSILTNCFVNITFFFMHLIFIYSNFDVSVLNFTNGFHDN